MRPGTRAGMGGWEEGYPDSMTMVRIRKCEHLIQMHAWGFRNFVGKFTRVRTGHDVQYCSRPFLVLLPLRLGCLNEI